MKLIEVVVLAGAHCISPVQQTGAVTEVAKVQCAVVIEKDTEGGTLRIIPAGASRQPEVAAVLERLDSDPPGVMTPGTTIEPAYAPPIAPPPSVTAALPEQASAAAAPAGAAPPAAEEAAPAPGTAETREAETGKAEPKKAEARKPEAKKKAGAGKDEGRTAEAKAKHKCLGEARPQWYTNEEGRRKYRCVIPG